MSQQLKYIVLVWTTFVGISQQSNLCRTNVRILFLVLAVFA